MLPRCAAWARWSRRHPVDSGHHRRAGRAATGAARHRGQTRPVLIVLSNPELQQATVDAEWKLRAAEAELANLESEAGKRPADARGRRRDGRERGQQEQAHRRPDVELNKLGLGGRSGRQDLRWPRRRTGPIAPGSKRSGWNQPGSDQGADRRAAGRRGTVPGALGLKKSQVEALRVGRA